jgi:hypothetical protein
MASDPTSILDDLLSSDEVEMIPSSLVVDAIRQKTVYPHKHESWIKDRICQLEKEESKGFNLGIDFVELINLRILVDIIHRVEEAEEKLINAIIMQKTEDGNISVDSASWAMTSIYTTVGHYYNTFVAAKISKPDAVPFDR